MSLKTVNLILIVVLIVLVGTIFLVRRDYTTRNIQVLPGMVTYVAYNAQSANPNFPDGKTLQRPVPGAVVSGFEPMDYSATPEDAVRAGLELKSPLNPKDSVADLERGAMVFANICKPCHGASGAGDGIIPQRGFPPPPSLFAENAMKLKDGQIYHIITYGQRNMPSFAAQVVRSDRWRVVKYIRSLQEQSKKSKVASK
jgi:mono/diheme cytochrome c family protein